MKIINLLASSLNRRDDEPNQVLADEIIRTEKIEEKLIETDYEAGSGANIIQPDV